MPFSDDQIALLATAVSALHTWQDTAGGVDVVLQEVTMLFPAPEGKTHEVKFTWDDVEERFDIRT
jgi:hypothetical protein